MADIKISALTAAGALTGAELVEVVQSGTNKKSTTQDIADLASGGPGYLVYAALLNQTGAAAPVATVIANTLGGTVVWARSSAGQYSATLASAFVVDKTFIPAAIVFLPYSGTDFLVISLTRGNSNTCDLITNYGANGAGAGTDGILVNYPVEIRVYP